MKRPRITHQKVCKVTKNNEGNYCFFSYRRGERKKKVYMKVFGVEKEISAKEGLAIVGFANVYTR